MKRTVLYDYHRNAGANFSQFGGYEMPLWYSSAKQEHLNVLKNIGLFDTSHMSIFTLKGSGAETVLGKAFTRNIFRLEEGKAVYGLYLRPDHTVVDDTVIYKISSDYL